MNPNSAQPQQPQQPNYPPMSVPDHDPGYVLGIVSLATSIIGMGLVGLITGIIGLKKSKQVGKSNGLALAGIIIGVLNIIISIVVTILLIAGVIGFGKVVNDVFQKCQELGPGTHMVDGVEYNCGSGADPSKSPVTEPQTN